MAITRRDFLKLSALSTAVLMTAELGLDSSKAYAQAQKYRIKTAKKTPTLCPFCSAGCGMLAYTDTKTGELLYVVGDPDHPVNRGGACSKGASIYQIRNIAPGNPNPKRLTKPLYRAPGSREFKEVTWDWAIAEIAKRIKETRDKTFIKSEEGIPVMRTDQIACLGGAALDNEETYLLQKLMRGLGVVYIEHQARL